MLKSFIQKEIYQIITRKSFWLLYAVIFILNIYTTTLQIFSYNNRTDAFQEYWIEHQKFSHLKPNELQSMPFSMAVLPPAKLGMLFTGLNQIIGVPPIEQNSLDFLFKKIDFGILTGILFSLLAIILSYQTISGEREEGTLKLIGSYPVKRAKIIVGKWLGIVFTICCLYALCYIVSMLLILILGNISLAKVDVFAMLFIFLIGLVYISATVLLGMFISVKVKHSYLSLLSALLVWALVVLVLPSIPDYVGQFVKKPSSLQIMHNTGEMEMNRKKEVREIKERYRRKGIVENEINEAAKEEIEEARKRFNTVRRKSNKQWENSLVKSAGISLGVSFLSPYACYTLAANEMAATGVLGSAMQMKQRDEHGRRVNNFLEEVKKRSEADSSFEPDYRDMPKFKFEYPGLIVRLIAAAVPFLLLFFFNILLFAMSFKAFQKYDVR